MPIIKTEVDVSCWCAQCGKGICHKVGVKGTDLEIDPCDCQTKRIEELEKEVEELNERLEYLKSGD